MELHNNLTGGKKTLTGTLSVLKDYTNWVFHHCYAIYFTFKDCKHAICNAHLLREVQALKEQNNVCVLVMYNFLMKLHHQTDNGTKNIINIAKKVIYRAKHAQTRQQAANEEIINNEILCNATKTRGKPKQSKGRNLLNLLIKQQEATLALAFVEVASFTNNIAEQAIRNVKIKQKIAIFRTERWTNLCQIQGFVNTVKKLKKNIF